MLVNLKSVAFGGVGLALVTGTAPMAQGASLTDIQAFHEVRASLPPAWGPDAIAEKASSGSSGSFQEEIEISYEDIPEDSPFYPDGGPYDGENPVYFPENFDTAEPYIDSSIDSSGVSFRGSIGAASSSGRAFPAEASSSIDHTFSVSEDSKWDTEFNSFSTVEGEEGYIELTDLSTGEAILSMTKNGSGFAGGVDDPLYLTRNTITLLAGRDYRLESGAAVNSSDAPSPNISATYFTMSESDNTVAIPTPTGVAMGGLALGALGLRRRGRRRRGSPSSAVEGEDTFSG